MEDMASENTSTLEASASYSANLSNPPVASIDDGCNNKNGRTITPTTSTEGYVITGNQVSTAHPDSRCPGSTMITDASY